MGAKLKLIKNSYMTEGEETYRAIIQHTETLTQEDLLDEMERPPRATSPRLSQVKAALKRLKNAI